MAGLGLIETLKEGAVGRKARFLAANHYLKFAHAIEKAYIQGYIHGISDAREEGRTK